MRLLHRETSMMEDCATSMSAHRMAATTTWPLSKSFKEALIQRIGADRYQMWFSHGVEFEFDSIRTQVSGSQDAEPIDAQCTDRQ